MKSFGFFVLLVISVSCATVDKSGISEDQFYVTRKYVGNFVDFRYTSPSGFGDPHIIWIKTSQDSLYGKISAYSRKCDFKAGDRLYLRRIYQSPGISGYWTYQIENDSEDKVWYKLCEFQNSRNKLAQAWF